MCYTRCYLSIYNADALFNFQFYSLIEVLQQVNSIINISLIFSLLDRHCHRCLRHGELGFPIL